MRSASFRRRKAGVDGEEPRSGASGAPADGGGSRLHPAAADRYGILVPSQTSEDELEAALNGLAPGYFDPPELFDALEHELRQLPVNFGGDQLEEVAEERTCVLEVRRRRRLARPGAARDSHAAWLERAAGMQHAGRACLQAVHGRRRLPACPPSCTHATAGCLHFRGRL